MRPYDPMVRIKFSEGQWAFRKRPHCAAYNARNGNFILRTTNVYDRLRGRLGILCAACMHSIRMTFLGN